MRRFAVCLSTLGIVAAPIVSGCSSDNTTSGDAGTDASNATMDSSTADAPAEGSPADAGKEAAACVPADASVETIAAGSQWGCYQSACSTALTACAADCICNDAILASLACAAAGGDTNTCFTNAVVSTGAESQVVVTLGCLRMKMPSCSPEGGSEAGTEGGTGEGGADTGVDGGTESGAAEGGVDGGGVDGAVSDAPAAG